MEWLSNLTNGENGSAINLVLITLAIAILLIVIVWIFRKITGSAARRAMRSRVPRLSITDSTTVDEKRYLVMVRRDNVEHLLLIGGANDLVVESNIIRVQTAQKPTTNIRNELQQVETREQQPASVAETTISAPVAGAAAIGAAGLAAVTSTASSAVKSASDTTDNLASNLSETTSNTTKLMNEKAGNVVEVIKETVSDAASSVADSSVDVVENITETISTRIESPEIETLEDIEIPEMDLESTISAKLDDALSSEALDINLDEPTVEADSTVLGSDVDSAMADPQSSSDDEMQRLLDELSSEAKEPAQ